MSMMKTLARVAAGVMLAKGIGTVMKNRNGGTGTGQTGGHTTGGGILGDLLGNNTGSAGSRQTGSGGLGDMLGQVLGGRSTGAGSGSPYGGQHSPDRSGTASGGLGGILDQLGGAAAGAGLGGLLGGLLGGGAGQKDLAQKDSQPSNDRSFGDLFNDALIKQDEPEVLPTPEQNAVAALMLKAMIQAAKSDGKIDDAEKQRLIGHLGDDIDEEERQFIRDQMAAPIDPQALAREVPKGLESQVYMMSLMAIDFDSQAEAEYLHALAQALGLNQSQTDSIHTRIGVKNLYS
ncbi:tellurite resistance TerB family protein [Paracoccus jiaweipingae]|uniref:tellurite resistance TerB family protein n=1 Tax=unclassified Paracoccus (in: a-proteobacteria) TaxID=2688777 RepID=UPI0037BA6D0B